MRFNENLKNTKEVMAFLKCVPTVYVVDDHYQIILLTKLNGTVKIRVGDDEYFEDVCGVLSTEKIILK